MQSDDENDWYAWMLLAQAGDADAYNKLLTSLSLAIKAYVLRRFSNVDFAEDCVQESLIALHEARHTFLPGRLIRPWVFAIVRNQTIDMLRRQKRRQRLFAADLDEPAAAVVESTPHEGTDDSADDRREAAGRVLASLPPQQKQALVFTKLMGLSINEAATRAGISAGAMKVRVHRATRAAIRVVEADRE
jgi:RNA polymerase sigma-70 factor, ECF subfamily